MGNFNLFEKKTTFLLEHFLEKSGQKNYSQHFLEKFIHYTF